MELDELLSPVYHDRQSGSAAIVKKTTELFMQYINTALLSTDIIDNSLFTSVLDNLLRHHNQFAVMHHFVEEFRAELSREPRSEKGRILSFLKQYRHSWDRVDQQVAGQIMQHIDLSQKTIGVHSHSSTIIAIFKTLKKQSIEGSFIQSESHPNLEGRIQAERLNNLSFQGRVITDMDFPRYGNEIDLILLGADVVYPDYFINKTGSALIAIWAQYAHIPVYVACDSRKMRKTALPEETPHNPEEIWEDVPKNIHIDNFYFESVQNELVTGFITEKDFFPPNKISKLY